MDLSPKLLPADEPLDFFGVESCRMLLGIVAIGSLSLTLIALLLGNDPIAIAGSISSMNIGLLVWLLHRGQLQLFVAQVGTVATFWIVAAYLILQANGFRDVAILLYPPIFLFASITLNRAFFWGTAILSLLFIIGLGLAEFTGHVVTPYSTFPLEMDLYLTVVVMVVVIIFMDMFMTAARRHISEIQAAKRASEKADRTKTEFLNMISHEMRSPLNPIVGYSELLSEDLTDPEQRSYVEQIQESSQQMLDMIETVLEYSRIVDGTVPLKRDEVRAAEIASAVESIGRNAAASKGIEFKVVPSGGTHYEATLFLDRHRVLQVLKHLVANAVHVSDAGGVLVRVDVATCPEQQHRLVCSVRDSGPRIEAGDLADVFEPFANIGNQGSSRRQTGLGLALSKCRHLAWLMEGDIRCQSSGERGAEFILEVPALAPPTHGD